jgi:predicted permease
MLLSGAGAAAGMLLSLWMAQSLIYLLPPTQFPIAVEVRAGGKGILFTAAVCVVAALIAAAAPALFAARTNINETLKEGGRSGSSGARPHRMRAVLVMCEVALAAVATIGAALFLRSFDNARKMDPGFDRDEVTIARFYLSPAGYSTIQEREFSRALYHGLKNAPGVADAAYADWVPLSFGQPPWNDAEVEGYAPARRDEDVKISRTLTSPGYFDLLHIPILAGRDFNELDDAGHPPVMIVNQAFARRYFAGADPLGRRVRYNGTVHRVVGMVRDIRDVPPGSPIRPYLFVPYQQGFWRGHSTFFYLRTRGGAGKAVAALRQEVSRLDPAAGLFDTFPLKEMTEAALYSQRVAASLLAGLGLLSLLLAASGLYSVMAYAVTERTQDIGIRMALGANAGNVLRMMLGYGMRLMAAGLVVGTLAAIAAGRTIAAIPGLLVNVSGLDPVTFLAGGGFLTLVALSACYLPARRATRVDPVNALRAQ